MKFTTDNKQRIIMIFTFFIEFYRIIMGTFLVIFVPQLCDDHMCSITDNLFRTNVLHLIALIFNFITFIYLIYFYKIELFRENYCIKYLDIDPKKPNNYLQTEIQQYPDIKNIIIKLNKQYYNTVQNSNILLTINFILSSITISFNYVGINTFASILTFLLLVTTKLYNASIISKKSINKTRMYSAYLKTSKTFNVIDFDFTKSNNTSTQQSNEIKITQNQNK